MFDHLVGSACGVLAVFAAYLPSRYWPALAWLPIRNAALPSAILSIVAGAVVGLGGFLTYSERVGRETSALIVKAAEAQLTGRLPHDPSLNIAPVAVAALTPFAFLITPLGLLATYLIVTGFARMITWVVHEPSGDPILTAIDTAIRRASGRARDALERHARESEEGAEEPDRLYVAEWAGVADADLVVVASRRKPEWEAGTFVITPEKWFVLRAPFDLRLPDGLRTIYPLKELTTNDVLRKGVSYELPLLRKARRRSVAHDSSYSSRPSEGGPPRSRS